MKYILIPIIILGLFGCTRDSEVSEVKLRFIISDTFVKSLRVDKTVVVGQWFAYRDLNDAGLDSEIKTAVTGIVKNENGKHRVSACRFTINNNHIVRQDWFDKLLDYKTENGRWMVGSVSMNSVTIFDIRLLEN